MHAARADHPYFRVVGKGIDKRVLACYRKDHFETFKDLAVALEGTTFKPRLPPRVWGPDPRVRPATLYLISGRRAATRDR